MEYILNNKEVETKDFTFNLVKGQKLLSKLKSYIDKNRNNVLTDSIYFYTVDKNSISVYNTNEEVLEKLNKRSDELKDRFLNMNRLMVEFYKFKNIIHKKNAEIGLDEVLTNIDYLTGLKKTYETFVARDYELEKISDKQINLIRTEALNEKEYRSTYVSFNTGCFDLEEIKEKIVKINKKLEELETKRDYLNSVNNVNIAFSEFTCEILGI